PAADPAARCPGAAPTAQESGPSSPPRAAPPAPVLAPRNNHEPGGHTESMEPEHLAQLLAERLNKIAPPGFHVLAGDGMLLYSATGSARRVGTSGTYIRANLDYSQPSAERIRLVSEQALDEFQDYIAEATAEPWPGTGQVPRAHAEVRGSRLHLWYGSADAPVLQCSPIDIP